jgi:hypothetical protein
MIDGEVEIAHEHEAAVGHGQMAYRDVGIRCFLTVL